MDVKSRILDELESEDASVSVKSVGATSQIDLKIFTESEISRTLLNSHEKKLKKRHTKIDPEKPVFIKS